MSGYYRTPLVAEEGTINSRIFRRFSRGGFQFRTKFNRLSPKRIVISLVVLLLVTFYIYNHWFIESYSGWSKNPPKAKYHCHRVPGENNDQNLEQTWSVDETATQQQNLRPDSKILVFIETQYSKLGKQIQETLEALRFRYKLEPVGRSLPLMTNSDKGKYSLIVFENIFKYYRMNKWNRDLLDKYCREFNVGMIGFLLSPEANLLNHPSSRKQLHGLNLPFKVDTINELRDYQLNPQSRVFRIAKPGTINVGVTPDGNWTVFHISNHSRYSSVARALPKNIRVDIHADDAYRHSTLISSDNHHLVPYEESKKHLRSTVIEDNGSRDGIRRIFFGNGLNFWLQKLIFIDSLSYLSLGKLSVPLQRYVQIDVDDVFVGERGTRIRPVDVDAMLDFQHRMQEFVPGFRFNLGFSGKFIHRGYSEENSGDDYLIENAEHFRWFCHMFSHSQAHLTDNLTAIELEMSQNKEFAIKNRFPLNSEYVISPHHSGVFPVHEPLYQAWKNVWNVRVTSTEEYPHLRPAYLRRGFIHRDVMVLPRQTCGLYTHTLFLERYPGGRSKLENSIFGGDLFFSFVLNQINIFMTHQGNYANDRLALYAFESVFKFMNCWTNLELKFLPPLQLAQKYFEIHPEDKDPVWTNPCDDRRHYNIWSLNKSCSQFPNSLILGPQKTGSTALYSFLSMHPGIKSNLPSNDTFEEIQFFNGKNYYKGIDWYMKHFEPRNGSTVVDQQQQNSTNVTVSKFFARIPPQFTDAQPHYFEKSSTYFDGEVVPARVHALLPHAKLIIILMNPVKRAYSWYQHMRAHNLSVALNFTFYEVITETTNKTLDPGTAKALHDLRNRCIQPGFYAVHLERWLQHFPPQQILLVDGDELRYNPISTMSKVQTFLKLQPHISYKKRLRFDPKKGFFCEIGSDGNLKCLGRSKGRHYPDVDSLSADYLHKLYLHQNVVLSKLLNRMRVPVPSWLELELSTAS